MATPYICLPCRRRLGQLPLRKGFRWQPRASFISLSKKSTRPTEATAEEKPNDDLLSLANSPDTRRIKHVTPVKRKRIPQSTRSNNPGDVLEALFEETLIPSDPAEVRGPLYNSFEPYKHLETMNKMLSGSGTPGESWQFFLEHFGPGSIKKGPAEQKATPSYLHASANNLLRRVIQSKSRSIHAPGLPTFTKLSRVYFQMGVLHGSDWASMVFILLQNIQDSFSKGEICDERLVADLIGTWNVACRPVGCFRDLPDDSVVALQWDNLPQIDAHDVATIVQKRGPLYSFGLLVPPFSIRHMNDIPMITLATFGLLTSEKIYDMTPVVDASPLLHKLACVIGEHSLAHSPFLGSGQSVEATPIAEYVKNNWAEIKDQAIGLYGSPTMNNKRSSRHSRSLSSQSNLRTDISTINKRLHDALLRKDIGQVDELWSDVSHWPAASKSMLASQSPGPVRGQLSDKLCNYFVMVYMGLRRPNRAIDVWNHMVQVDLPPSLATWDSMMSGCKASRDWKALEDVWNKMHVLGVKPDVVCWTTRISTLLECKQIDLGIRALDEMGRLWLTEVKQKYPKKSLEELQLVENVEAAVKPTIGTINAAVVGLLRKGKPDAAHRILTWAGKLGISPDIITYNTLLRPLIRDGNTTAAMDLLKDMQKSGIQADVGTFTTILEETFRYSDQYTAEEQKEIVENVFAELENAGVIASMHTYAKIIYQLVQSNNGDMTTVNAVMERMAQQGLEPSTQIYTILVEHYFKQDPPDLDAIRLIIGRSSMVAGSTDVVFWDRCIEGYSRAGETATALRILGKLNSASQKPGWDALRMLLIALAESQQWDMAKTLVQDMVVDTGGPLPQDVRGKEGQHKFWNLAADMELL